MKKLILLRTVLYFAIPFINALSAENIFVNAAESDTESKTGNVESRTIHPSGHVRYQNPYSYLGIHRPGRNYSFAAKDTHNGGNVTAPDVVHISAITNNSPTVSITSPVDGARYTALATIVLGAEAKDEDGNIRKVEFYNGNTLIGTEENAPFLRNWSHVAQGNYVITAKATDNKGNSTISSPVHISVLPVNFLTVNITRPGNNASYTAPATITLSADAGGPNPIVKTDFYSGKALIFTEHVFPYSNQWKNVPAGNYSVTAKATDSKGNVAVSVPIQISVSQKTPCSFASQPVFGLSFNGTHVANINNGSPDPEESASLTIADGGQFTTSSLFNSSSSNLYKITYVSNGGSLLFDDHLPADRVVTASQFTGMAGTHTITLADPAVEGTLTETITPFRDLNNNKALDPGDCAGDAIIFRYSVLSRPTFGFTLAGTNLPGSINLGNINNGISDPGESGGVSICESGHYITSAYFHSSLTNLYSIRVKTTGPGLFVDNKPQAGDRVLTAAQLTATAGFHAISAVNTRVLTTAEETITPFRDMNNDSVLDTGDIAGDPINITYTFTAKVTWYKDADGDGHASEIVITCGTTPDVPYTLTPLPVDDCDDNDPTPCPDNNITVNMTSPVNGANYTDAATILLSADAGVENDSIKQVDFYERGQLIFSVNKAPFSRKWYKVPAGEYFINAKATATNGKSTFSDTVHIKVLFSDNLTVNLTNPGNRATFTAPATITLTADVKGPNDIVKTDFYNGSTLIFTEDVFPYSNKWRNVPAGNYIIRAKAFDREGNVAVSAPLTVIVNAPAPFAGSRRASANLQTSAAGTKSLRPTPNPVHNILNIGLPGLQLPNKAIVSLISPSGTIMQTNQFNKWQTVQLDVSSLASGMYVIKIISGDKILYSQFVKTD